MSETTVPSLGLKSLLLRWLGCAVIIATALCISLEQGLTRFDPLTIAACFGVAALMAPAVWVIYKFIHIVVSPCRMP